MDTNQPLPQPEQPVVPPFRSAFGTKMPSSIAFIAALLFFVMPFIDIKCNGMSLKQITGLQLAVGFKTGTDWDMKNERMEVGENFDYKAKTEKRSRNKFALIALGLGIIGLVLSYSTARKGGMGGMITGTAAAISLVLLFIDIKRNVKKSMSSLDNMDKGMEDSIRVSVDFTAGFYLALLAFLAASYFSYWRWRANDR
jgi:hypothetical protein